MNSKELRLGNLVNHRNWRKMARMIVPIPGVVTQISNRGFVVDHKWSGIEAEPIPISLEWLKRMDFSNEIDTKEAWLYLHGDSDKPYLRSDGFKEVYLFQWQIQKIGKPCLYVHQVQNLYFALTGEDIEIKLS